jgi:molybdopterin-guanine dinucleotide biosynthesis adapter protein
MRTIDEVPSLKDLEVLAGNADIVIREGFKEDALNKIEVFRSGVSGQQPLCAADRSFLALVSDNPLDVAIPRFDWNDAAAVADFIATKL